MDGICHSNPGWTIQCGSSNWQIYTKITAVFGYWRGSLYACITRLSAPSYSGIATQHKRKHPLPGANFYQSASVNSSNPDGGTSHTMHRTKSKVQVSQYHLFQQKDRMPGNNNHKLKSSSASSHRVRSIPNMYRDTSTVSTMTFEEQRKRRQTIYPCE